MATSRPRTKGTTNPAGDDPAGTPARRGSARWALVATSLGFAVVQLDVSVVNVAIKPIGADLGGGISGLQWVVGAYTLAFAALILSAGALGDRIGARRMFVAGFALFTLASAACGLAPGLGVLIAARAVQGVGAAVLVPCSLSLLNHAYRDPQARGRAIGLWAAGASVALSAGPLLGGILTSSLGWRSIFFINLPLGLAGILLTLRYASETPRSAGRGVDLPGQLAAIVTLVALAGAMILAGQQGFGHGLVLAGFGLAVVALVAFIGIEAHRQRPMLPLSLFRSRTFAASSAIGLVINVAFYGLIFVFSLYFQTTRHYSVLLTGLAFAPTTVAVGAANLLASRIARVIGLRTTLAGAALLTAAGLGGLLVAGAGPGYLVIVGQLVAVGFGLGVIVPLITSALLGSVDRENSGVASGTLNTARQTGSVIGVGLFGSLAAGHLVHGLHLSLIIGAALALAVAALAPALHPDA
jgi:MFS transporter, DHA2 family, methylenomycin A resistance protein